MRAIGINVFYCHQLQRFSILQFLKDNFVRKLKKSVQYFQSSDVPVNTDRSEVFVYKPQVDRIGALVDKDDILVTGFGTIGNARLVSQRVAGSCFANNVCRIRSHNNELTGFYYAFLASKYGRSQLNKNASGAVVRYIEAPGIKKTLIPVFPEEKQKEIDQLIHDAASLRDKAAELFDKAKSILQEFIGVTFYRTNGYRTASTSIKDIRSSLKMRLDPPVFVNDGVEMLERISDKTQLLKECNVTLSYPGMFKRSYVKDGYPYMKGSDIFDINPFAHCEHLSKTRTPNIEQLWLKDGLILITCAGACGQIKLITKEYEDKQAIGSPDIIRLKSNDPLFTSEYLYTYLSLRSSYDYMQSLKYGAVIERFDVQNIETVPIFIPTKELSVTITDIIREYKDCLYSAFCKEEKAISMVETEIESW
ncbi:MAG: restriction endonuclease subunit S, partial [Muribaculaceae bacterium]|nr:restriction endonuclease subunit S [Muribaculaceae bacterium]